MKITLTKDQIEKEYYQINDNDIFKEKTITENKNAIKDIFTMFLNNWTDTETIKIAKEHSINSRDLKNTLEQLQAIILK